MKFLTFLTAAASVAAAPCKRKPALAAGQCTDFLIPVQASASNTLILDPTNQLNSPSGITSFLSSIVGAAGQLTGFIPESGTYNIGARYCAPATGGSIPAERASHVQFLHHGIPFNKDYWQGMDYSPLGGNNNYIAYANAQGYPVLAIDGLGHGASSKPDPILVVQQSLETVIDQELIKKLRAGTINQVVPKAEKVIYVGHSAGSLIAGGLATKYPKDTFDATVLTGWTYTVAQSLPGLLLTFAEPAALQNPARFSHTALGYLTFSSEDGVRNTYFGTDDSFNGGLPAHFIENQDTVGAGELLTVYSGSETARGYNGDVFVLTGAQDALFCGLGSRHLGTSDCGNSADNILQKSQQYWPDARSYEYFMVPDAGHAVTLHKSAQTQFAKVHDFLQRKGY